jgi:hypothetical protein
VAEILGRANGAYLDVAEPAATGDQEYLLDWMLAHPHELGERCHPGTAQRGGIREMAGRGYIPATLSWLTAMNREAQAQGVPILFFAIPVGSVDPDYARFWQSWPLTDTWNRFCAELHRQLVDAAVREGLPLIDLGPDLAGIPGTYRKLDGHWTQRGEDLVADRVARELSRLMDRSTQLK